MDKPPEQELSPVSPESYAAAPGRQTRAARARSSAVAPILALSVAALSVVMVVLTPVIAAAASSLGSLSGGSITLAAGMAIIGGLIAARRPGHRIGWLLLAIAFTQALVDFSSAYAHYSLLYRPGSLPLGDVFSWFEEWMWMPGFGLVATLMLLFPSGTPPSRRWWPLAVVTGLTLVTMTVTDAIASWPHRGLELENTTSPGAFDAVVVHASIVILGGCLVLSLASLALRYRGAGADERRQLKWITYAAVVFLAGSLASFDVPVPGPFTATFAAVAVLALPVAIGAAILRYRLYDIDVVINRTLVYGALAAFITAVYVAIVVGLGTLIGSRGQPNLLLSIVATAVVAVGFQPVRERVQKLANRLVYGKRATPYEVLAEFSEHVAESYAAADVLTRMARVLAEGTSAQTARVWLRGGQQLRPAATWPNGRRDQGGEDAAAPLRLTGQLLPEIPDADRAVAVRHQGELLGALTVRKRQGESLTPIEEKLLEDLSNQAGLVLRNVGLTADLEARLEDLRESRQRLVAAQDEERRRLERNLHDGAQQNLVALKVKLGLAEMLVEKDPARAQQMLTELGVDANEALETLRDLARGIYPPLLADRGLVAALESQARKATLRLEVDAEGIGRYPQEVEAAVYFCCLEALQNVQKYAAAQDAVVRLNGNDSGLTFEVTDDGQGFNASLVKRGAGLTNMTDRIQALGGRLEVSAAPGQGTRVQGSLPGLLALAPA